MRIPWAAVHGPFEEPCRYRGHISNGVLKYVLSSVSFESEGKGLDHSRRHQRLQGHAQELLPQAHGALGRAPRAAGAFAAGQQAVLEAVLSLPPQYKDVVYLHFYEDYTAPQISKILGKNVNTVYTIITRSKQMLREKLRGEGYE